MKQAVLDAIDAGYRHVDGAHVYSNEAEVGDAVNEKIAEGVIKRFSIRKIYRIYFAIIVFVCVFGRSDIFLTSKLWNTDHHPDNVRSALLKTLENLNTPYLDLYLIHFPVALKHGGALFPVGDDGKLEFEDVDYVDTWRELERAVDDGLVRSIGVSNFNKEQTERILNASRIRPAVSQVELHPYLSQQKLVNYLQSEGIVVTGYSPLGSPDRPTKKSSDPPLLEHAVLQELAEKYKKSTAQILIRYQLDRGLVVIPKSVTKSRIVSNFNVFDFELNAEDLEKINGFNLNHRFVEFQA